jgi:hypothetical protein
MKAAFKQVCFAEIIHQAALASHGSHCHASRLLTASGAGLATQRSSCRQHGAGENAAIIPVAFETLCVMMLVSHECSAKHWHLVGGPASGPHMRIVSASCSVQEGAHHVGSHVSVFSSDTAEQHALNAYQMCVHLAVQASYASAKTPLVVCCWRSPVVAASPLTHCCSLTCADLRDQQGKLQAGCRLLHVSYSVVTTEVESTSQLKCYLMRRSAMGAVKYQREAFGNLTSWHSTNSLTPILKEPWQLARN